MCHEGRLKRLRRLWRQGLAIHTLLQRPRHQSGGALAPGLKNATLYFVPLDVDDVSMITLKSFSSRRGGTEVRARVTRAMLPMHEAPLMGAARKERTGGGQDGPRTAVATPWQQIKRDGGGGSRPPGSVQILNGRLG